MNTYEELYRNYCELLEKGIEPKYVMMDVQTILSLNSKEFCSAMIIEGNVRRIFGLTVLSCSKVPNGMAIFLTKNEFVNLITLEKMLLDNMGCIKLTDETSFAKDILIHQMWLGEFQ